MQQRRVLISAADGKRSAVSSCGLRWVVHGYARQARRVATGRDGLSLYLPTSRVQQQQKYRQTTTTITQSDFDDLFLLAFVDTELVFVCHNFISH